LDPAVGDEFAADDMIAEEEDRKAKEGVDVDSP